MTPIMVVAEAGSVHDGSFGNAKKLVDLAAQCGAEAVKFQTHIAAAETLRDAPMPAHFTGERRYQYFERTAFTPEQWRAIKDWCEERGIEFLSSPFSIEAVDLLERVGVMRHKVPSGEVTNLPLIEAVAQTGKPMLLSSGMSTWPELDAAVNTVLRHHGRLTVLQCTSAYPCPYEQVGLNVMLEMKARYRLPVGLSDHTLTNYASFAAAALGATVIEKHITFSRRMYGSDACFSLEPAELVDLVQGIRAIEAALAARVDKDDTSRLGDMKAAFEKSLVALVDIPAGAAIGREMIGFKKPGTGISPGGLDQVLGKRATLPIRAGTIFAHEMLG